MWYAKGYMFFLGSVQFNADNNKVTILPTFSLPVIFTK